MSNDNNGISDFFNRTLNDIKDMPAMNQVIVGGTAGLASGYVFSRVGKMAAFSIGSGVLVLQLAQHCGYIEIKWGKKSKIEQMKKKMLKAAEEVGITTNGSSNGKLDKFADEMKTFLQNNITLGVSFGAGLLIGISI
jgi:uncharacterized membrane protein (Fun14 family)